MRQWFVPHPSVKTVVVSHNAEGGVRVGAAEDPFEAKVAGYTAAWAALPSSVEHIIVLRDTPDARPTTNDCVERALAKRKRASLACAVPRQEALATDPAVVAATRAATPRIQVIDLTPLMCDAARCYNVIGGVLVHKDIGHMTRTFSATLGRYLLRALDRLQRGWPTHTSLPELAESAITGRAVAPTDERSARPLNHLLGFDECPRAGPFPLRSINWLPAGPALALVSTQPLWLTNAACPR